jgi:hypothetical protein
MATCSATTLINSAKCFTCLSDGQRDVAIIALLEQWLGEALTPAQLLDAGKCFTCLTDGQRDICKIQLLCNILGGL